VRSGRILVVDDQAELAENISEVLQGLGFDTDVATSAESALARIRRGGITALITDFRLPGQSGAELIGELRRRGERMPALVMSAYTDDRTIDASHAAGAWLFLPKPVPLETLMEVFQSLAKQPAATLLIDDEASLTDNLAEALAGAGYETIVSRSAEEALSQPPRRLQTAVVDYRLPDGTGIEVARKLRARDPAIRILFISGYPDELRAQLSDLGETDTMEKPLDTRSVISWIELATQGKPPR
jgi:DNA-binding NtrC family response regulator